MRLTFAGLSDVGRVRHENQDAIALPDPKGSHGAWLFVLADGMGGMAGGAQASHLALDTLTQEVALAWGAGKRSSDPKPVLRQAAEKANQAIWDQAQQDPSLKGMGTTLVAVLLHRRQAFIANVGDSRAYLLRGGKLTQLTEDHSLVQEEVARGVITPEEARTHNMRNVLTRALGAAETVEVDLFTRDLAAGDLLLMCSDGLHGPVAANTIRELLSASRNPQEAAARLVEAANSQGGPDNVSVVLARVDELPPAEKEPGTTTQPRGRARPGGLRGLFNRLTGR